MKREDHIHRKSQTFTSHRYPVFMKPLVLMVTSQPSIYIASSAMLKPCVVRFLLKVMSLNRANQFTRVTEPSVSNSGKKRWRLRLIYLHICVCVCVFFCFGISLHICINLLVYSTIFCATGELH